MSRNVFRPEVVECASNHTAIMTKGRRSMPKKVTWRTGQNHGLIATGIGLLLLAAGGCAGEAPKPSPTVTQDQVRSHADKAFEQLKQEEKNHAVDSGVVPY